eukprot:TRINITY_DN5803_c0_g1_i2.p2 TRINITY_DN5803_c0_g1~~TRINITY_DN5803_c0_g1_i2.p2  ORF type:complete len:173 (-),score=11.39 TRINITY_DN5803_c0_g1_i2:148-666(-)
MCIRDSLASKREKGTLSAYSIFNKGGQKLLGDMSLEDLDAQFRNNGMPARGENNTSRARDDSDDDEPITYLTDIKKQNVSKLGRETCYCGSGRKYKRCCIYKDKRLLQQPSQSAEAKKYDQTIADVFVADSMVEYGGTNNVCLSLYTLSLYGTQIYLPALFSTNFEYFDILA